MPHKSLMHHDIQKNISYHNFYFFSNMQVKGIWIISTFRKFLKNVVMHRPTIKKSLIKVTTAVPEDATVNEWVENIVSF